MIENVVNIWNESVNNHFAGINKKVYGLATPIVKQDNGNVFFPAIVEVDGNSKYVFADDDYYFGIYHKLNNIDYSKGASRGYGDNSIIQAVADLQLICWGFIEFKENLHMERLLHRLSPKEVIFGQVNFDRRQVFNSEFSGVNFFLPPELWLFSVRYKVQYTVDKNCVTPNP